MIRTLLIFFIKSYKLLMSPFLPKSCRFHPSCSMYAVDAIKHFGIFKGSLKAFIRILKCNPFNPGGYDPAVKEN